MIMWQQYDINNVMANIINGINGINDIINVCINGINKQLLNQWQWPMK